MDPQSSSYIHIKHTSIQCNFCWHFFRNSAELKQHQHDQHLVLYVLNENGFNVTSKNVIGICPICDSPSSKEHLLDHYLSIKFGNHKDYDHRYCNNISHLKSMESFVATLHPVAEKCQKEHNLYDQCSNDFKCKFCSKVLSNNDLAFHFWYVHRNELEQLLRAKTNSTLANDIEKRHFKRRRKLVPKKCIVKREELLTNSLNKEPTILESCSLFSKESGLAKEAELESNNNSVISVNDSISKIRIVEGEETLVNNVNIESRKLQCCSPFIKESLLVKETEFKLNDSVIPVDGSTSNNSDTKRDQTAMNNVNKQSKASELCPPLIKESLHTKETNLKLNTNSDISVADSISKNNIAKDEKIPINNVNKEPKNLQCSSLIKESLPAKETEFKLNSSPVISVDDSISKMGDTKHEQTLINNVNKESKKPERDSPFIKESLLAKETKFKLNNASVISVNDSISKNSAVKCEETRTNSVNQEPKALGSCKLLIKESLLAKDDKVELNKYSDLSVDDSISKNIVTSEKPFMNSVKEKPKKLESCALLIKESSLIKEADIQSRKNSGISLNDSISKKIAILLPRCSPNTSAHRPLAKKSVNNLFVNESAISANEIDKKEKNSIQKSSPELNSSSKVSEILEISKANSKYYEEQSHDEYISMLDYLPLEKRTEANTTGTGVSQVNMQHLKKKLHLNHSARAKKMNNSKSKQFNRNSDGTLNVHKVLSKDSYQIKHVKRQKNYKVVNKKYPDFQSSEQSGRKRKYENVLSRFDSYNYSTCISKKLSGFFLKKEVFF